LSGVIDCCAFTQLIAWLVMSTVKWYCSIFGGSTLSNPS